MVGNCVSSIGGSEVGGTRVVVINARVETPLVAQLSHIVSEISNVFGYRLRGVALNTLCKGFSVVGNGFVVRLSIVGLAL